jgi:hypothetical protein
MREQEARTMKKKTITPTKPQPEITREVAEQVTKAVVKLEAVRGLLFTHFEAVSNQNDSPFDDESVVQGTCFLMQESLKMLTGSHLYDFMLDLYNPRSAMMATAFPNRETD